MRGDQELATSIAILDALGPDEGRVCDWEYAIKIPSNVISELVEQA